MWCDLKSLVTIQILLCSAMPVVQADPNQAVWIDSDPACGHAQTDDVDDCWAILLAMRSSTLEIRGISTLFGNGSGTKSYITATNLVNRFGKEGQIPSIFRGADETLDSSALKRNEASDAMARALSNESLTIIALGPLTNIATLILQYPEHVANIKRVIAIAGQRPEPGLGFYPGTSRIFHLHDLNFRKDVAAFDVLLQSNIPVTLVPYEVAAKISIESTDLAILEKGSFESRWLSETSKPWLQFWNNKLGVKGFYPFDSLAIGVLTWPSLFDCELIPAKIQHKRSFFVTSRDNLLVSHVFNENRYVEYCHGIDQNFKMELIKKFL